jgi:hypothetical protein
MQDIMEMSLQINSLRRPPEAVKYATTKFQKVKLSTKKERRS